MGEKKILRKRNEELAMYVAKNAPLAIYCNFLGFPLFRNGKVSIWKLVDLLQLSLLQ